MTAVASSITCRAFDIPASSVGALVCNGVGAGVFGDLVGELVGDDVGLLVGAIVEFIVLFVIVPFMVELSY